MGKRSNFERKERDFYSTPEKAVLPLLPHIQHIKEYIEPCAGDGRLVNHLSVRGYSCKLLMDIEPNREDIRKADVFDETIVFCGETVITNPPWDRKILHPMIEHLLKHCEEVWLLFDADWIHTKQSSELIKYCHKVVSIGRVKWIEGSKHTGKDNCCWYQFKPIKCENTTFIGR